MSKRKRDGSAGPLIRPHVEEGPLSSRQKCAAVKIFHGRKTLQQALRIAKGFERQKLARRQKRAVTKKDAADLTRVVAEIQALKDLDLAAIAEAYLNKVLLRSKAIANAAALPPGVCGSHKARQDDGAVTIAARLYNSNPVKAALRGALPPIRLALGLGIESSQDFNASGVEFRWAIPSPILHEPSIRSSNSSFLGAQRIDAAAVPCARIKRSLLRTEELNISVNGEALSDVEALVADTSEYELASNDAASDEEGDLEDLPVISALSSSTSRSASPAQQVQRERLSEGSKASKSAFLPSLTMGGYWSGSNSGSEADKIEELAPRKNRRGQRARQKIWEQKFGQKAKHLQEDRLEPRPGERESWSQGWDLRRGAQSGDSGTRRGHAPRWQARGDRKSGHILGQDAASGSNATEVAPKSSKAGKAAGPSLHPSWEAANKAKELRQQSGASFVGKRTVFD